MNEVVFVSKEQDLDTAPIAGGKLVVHRGLKFAVVERRLRLRFGEVRLQPVMPGTDAYTKFGGEASYVVSVG